MAAGMYLLLMWGYLTLPAPQLFAAFAALIMSIALLFWVNEARPGDNDLHSTDNPVISEQDAHRLGAVNDPTLRASIRRLDALKAELNEQYAQFGREQSRMNSKGLGTWHRHRGPEGEEP